ncbi:MAG: hypothetical protein JXC32_19685 [Anaerolineae bacterium]|nr:hypothetical protein [Anaerolineae bacterium]
MADLQSQSNRDYLLLWGEALCQYLLTEGVYRADARAQRVPASLLAGSSGGENDAPVKRLVIARGPLVFLPGNKATVGYLSPLTGLPHYSFVGGRGFAELFNLGLDAIVLESRSSSCPAQRDAPAAYVVITGRAPELRIAWRGGDEVPRGQRSAYHWLVAQELDGRPEAGSIFAVGDGGLRGFKTANIGVDGIYHAGRGGAGLVFAHFVLALVLSGEQQDLRNWLGASADAFLALRQREINPRVEQFCERLSRRDGGTVTKLYQTGQGSRPTLPSRNAQRVGYRLADLGARNVLRRQRVGQAGCHWCHVNCRHWHWVDVDYTEAGRDRYLDDFEPTYALFSMLDLAPASDTLRGRLDLIERVDQVLVVPIEQLGLDVIDMGVALAGLFEGLEQGLVPLADVPADLRSGPYFGSVVKAAVVLDDLRSPEPAYAVRALADGPEGLVSAYPPLKDIVFNSGPGTLANPGHANALWTFLMPFSRFFGHYSGQIYKIEGDLATDMSLEEIRALFDHVIATMLRHEALICIGNALSTCAFTFVIYTEEGLGERLGGQGLLSRTLAHYGLDVHDQDLLWFGRAFLAQSIALKLAYGWRPPRAEDFPKRVLRVLSEVLGRPQNDVARLLDLLIETWLSQAGELLRAYGHQVPW